MSNQPPLFHRLKSLFSFFLGEDAVPRLSPAAFAERRRPGDAVVDVRTPQEFAMGHLPGARNVNVMAPDFRVRIEALGLDPQQPVYLYCRTGTRSQRAGHLLRQMGFTEVYNLGSLDALNRETEGSRSKSVDR